MNTSQLLRVSFFCCSAIIISACGTTVTNPQPAVVEQSEEGRSATDDSQPSVDESSETAASATDNAEQAGVEDAAQHCLPAPIPEVVEVKRVIKTHLAVIGATEYLTLKDQKIRLKARIDTGAQTTSIGVNNIQMFERDGDRWVKFNIIDRNTQKVAEFKRPLKRHARIKQHEQDYDRRPVIEMVLTIGTISRKIDVTLNNRDDFKYPALIGRNFLDNKAVVDVSRRYIMLDSAN